MAIMIRDQRVETVAEAESLTATLTAFDSFDDLLNAPGGYRPSLTRPCQQTLADLYDDAQKRRGDPRRAFRG